MVRFSDMLGGSGEPDDDAATESPYAALANEAGDPEADEADEDAAADDKQDATKEPVPMSTFETPEAVLDRLTQYATSARASEPVAPEPVAPEPVAPEPVAPEPVAPDTEPDTEPEPSPDEPLRPVGDDFLPNVRGIVRRGGRGRKRHP